MSSHLSGAVATLRRSLLPVTAALLAAAPPANAQDGRAILQKSLDTYQALAGYDGQSNADTSFVSGGKALRKESLHARMVYKRPNKLMLDFTTPAGSHRVYCDGATLTIFDPSPNVYRRVPAPASNMAGLLPLLARNAGVSAGLDPLYFVSINKLPPQLNNYGLKSDASFNGKPVYLVTAQIKTEKRVLKDPRGQSFVIPARVSNWSWWIDKQTMLIQQVEARTPNLTVPIAVRDKNGKTTPKTVVGESMLRYTITDAHANPALADSLFTFTPPAGASEEKSVNDLLRGGKK